MKPILTAFLIITFNFYGNTQANNTFYIGCGTYIELDSAIFNKLTIKVNGADTVRIQPKTLLVIPFSNLVNIKVSFKDSTIISSKFKALTPPLPELAILSDNKDITSSKIFPIKTKIVTILARADTNFAKIKPKDCRYRVVQSEFIVKRSGKTICVDKWNENDWQRPINCNLKQNDNLTINFIAVQRYNFRNEKKITQVNKSKEFTVK